MKFVKPLSPLPEAVLRRDAVLRRRETLLRDAVARRAGLRRRLVDLRLRLVDFLRVVLRFAGDLRRRVVLLRFAGDLRRRVVGFRRVVLLRFAGDFRRVVLRRREVALRFGAAFLRRVVDFLRVVLLRAGARRRDVDLRAAVFLLLVVVLFRAMVFPPVERVLAFRLLVLFLRLAALLLAARLLAGLRGFKITTSDNGIVLNLPELRLWYKGVVGVYVGVIQNGHNAEDSRRGTWVGLFEPQTG